MKITDIEKNILRDALKELQTTGTFPTTSLFRVKHESTRKYIDELLQRDFLRDDNGKTQVTIMGLRTIGSSESKDIINRCEELLPALKDAYRSEPGAEWPAERLAERTKMNIADVEQTLFFLKDLSIWSGLTQDASTSRVKSVRMKEAILDIISLNEALLARENVIGRLKNRQPTKGSIHLNSKPTNNVERWQIKQPLGEGGQAHTFIVVDRDHKNGDLFALKRLKNTNRLPRFKAEVEAIRSLNHLNVIKIVDHQFETDHPYFVSEFCAAGSLAKKTFPLERALKIFEDICSGLTAAHSIGITHRDIKPENILLRQIDGEAIVADFGLCYIEDGERHTIVDEAVGARLFIAPELEDGRAEVIKPTSDVYSLGKLLYWLLSEGQIFSREKHRESKYDLMTKLGPKFEYVNRLLDKMLVIDPLKRLPDASAVLTETRELMRLLHGKFNVIGPGIPQLCMYCGIGHYEMKVTGNGASAHNFGMQATGNADQRIMVCKECGHVQFFRIETAVKKEWWRSESQ